MANNARTPEDLERKYNFASLLGLSKNVKMNEKSITKVNNELYNFVESTASQIKDLNAQVDGKISTWYYSGEPKLNNSPANEWATDEEKSAHTGDLYYDRATGYTYIFEYVNSAYKWSRVKDEDIVEAMSLANSAKDTADNKRQIFTVQPTTPYACGDLWIKENEIYICQVERLEGDFTEGDWINDLKYTDNTYAKAIVDELGGSTTTVLEGTVTQYTKSWVKFTDLATGGSTVINGANITTGTINTDNVTIGNGNVQLDDEGLKLSNGAKVVGENGLMNTYLFTSQESFGMCGYEGSDPTGWDNESVSKLKQKILFYIPEGLNITSAKLILTHAPVRWQYTDGSSIWGYCRKLKAYKATNINSKIFDAFFASEYSDVDNTIYTEISGALGTNGWTPSVPSNSSHNTETKESIDIKNSISSGLNEIAIQPADEPASQTWSGSEIALRTAFVYAMLKIDGYMSY